uniref:ATP-dependent endonuclease n=1 Tax=Caldisericum exile TaxID=693075 RepID=A0A7C4XSN4_9BACT
MIVRKLKIKNFRSIKDLDIDLGRINALIGPNNAGKSNIMKALDLIIGESFPTVRSFEDNDFYKFDKSNQILIEVYFDKSLNLNNNVYGFKLTFDGINVDYLAIDSEGNEVRYSNDRQMKVSKDMREEVALMFLPLERLATKQISPSQWTLYGKMLRKLNDEIEEDKRKSFKELLEKGYSDNFYPALKNFEDILRRYISEQTGFEFSLRLSILDPLELTRNLRPYFREDDLEYDVENMGAGIQSALAIAIARAYVDIIHKPLIIAIEEPELYLHPHACRRLYRLLSELSNESGFQILYTTHETSFVDIAKFEQVNIVRKEGGQTRVYQGSKIDGTSLSDVSVASKFNSEINEAFFAEHIILVEGYSDKIACRSALERLGLDLDDKNVSIIDCGGVKEIPKLAKVFKAFKFKVYVLLDDDDDAKKRIETLKDIVGNDNVFIQSPDLEGMLGRERLKELIIQSELSPKYDNSKRLKLNKEQALEVLCKYFEEVPEFDLRKMPYFRLMDKIQIGTTGRN